MTRVEVAFWALTEETRREPTGVKISECARTCHLKDLNQESKGGDLTKDVFKVEVNYTFPTVRVNSLPGTVSG